ncbi:ABC transporter permease [Jeotgalibacillus proteolyticus]|uniref:Metabolite permease n=1 Tax=Jeotgalibacillus proteolyticus TaxID=2082395 RepID=A0A2S5GD80_9BACL|nr:ABC transporter permease [Jeotgalibacillus proteolyticus]PPA70871.1 metabolite permease [Jeotgalibacillus proteolyticus]
MKLKDQFRFILQNMKKNKIRVFMTVLATAMGCAFLIVLASVAFGLHDSVLKDTMESREINEIEIAGYEDDNGTYRSINDEDIARFEEMENVRTVTRAKVVGQEITASLGDDYEGTISASSTYFPAELEAGARLAEGRLPESSNEVVIGHHFIPLLTPSNENTEDLWDEQGFVKEELRYNEAIIGETITLELKKIEDGEESTGQFEVTVTGVMEQPSREWMWDQKVYISEDLLGEMEAFTGTPRADLYDPSDEENEGLIADGYNSVIVVAANLESVQGISDQLKDQNYLTYSIVNEMKQVNMLFTIAKAGLIFIGTIAILIASIGIYNTMTMAVTERAPDIGIMKAIGASPKVIKRIFLLESSYIGLIGAAIGIVAAYIISILVNIGLPLILEAVFEEELPAGLMFSYIPFSLVVIAIVICLTVTILSGFRPAKRATEIDVLKAMRREV